MLTPLKLIMFPSTNKMKKIVVGQLEAEEEEVDTLEAKIEEVAIEVVTMRAVVLTEEVVAIITNKITETEVRGIEEISKEKRKKENGKIALAKKLNME